MANRSDLLNDFITPTDNGERRVTYFDHKRGFKRCEIAERRLFTSSPQSRGMITLRKINLVKVFCDEFLLGEILESCLTFKDLCDTVQIYDSDAADVESSISLTPVNKITDLQEHEAPQAHLLNQQSDCEVEVNMASLSISKQIPTFGLASKPDTRTDDCERELSGSFIQISSLRKENDDSLNDQHCDSVVSSRDVKLKKGVKSKKQSNIQKVVSSKKHSNQTITDMPQFINADSNCVSSTGPSDWINEKLSDRNNECTDPSEQLPDSISVFKIPTMCVQSKRVNKRKPQEPDPKVSTKVQNSIENISMSSFNDSSFSPVQFTLPPESPQEISAITTQIEQCINSELCGQTPISVTELIPIQNNSKVASKRKVKDAKASVAEVRNIRKSSKGNGVMETEIRQKTRSVKKNSTQKYHVEEDRRECADSMDVVKSHKISSRIKAARKPEECAKMKNFSEIARDKVLECSAVTAVQKSQHVLEEDITMNACNEQVKCFETNTSEALTDETHGKVLTRKRRGLIKNQVQSDTVKENNVGNRKSQIAKKLHKHGTLEQSMVLMANSGEVSASNEVLASTNNQSDEKLGSNVLLKSKRAFIDAGVKSLRSRNSLTKPTSSKSQQSNHASCPVLMANSGEVSVSNEVLASTNNQSDEKLGSNVLLKSKRAFIDEGVKSLRSRNSLTKPTSSKSQQSNHASCPVLMANSGEVSVSNEVLASTNNQSDEKLGSNVLLKSKRAFIDAGVKSLRSRNSLTKPTSSKSQQSNHASCPVLMANSGEVSVSNEVLASTNNQSDEKLGSNVLLKSKRAFNDAGVKSLRSRNSLTKPTSSKSQQSNHTSFPVLNIEDKRSNSTSSPCQELHDQCVSSEDRKQPEIRLHFNPQSSLSDSKRRNRSKKAASADIHKQTEIVLNATTNLKMNKLQEVCDTSVHDGQHDEAKLQVAENSFDVKMPPRQMRKRKININLTENVNDETLQVSVPTAAHAKVVKQTKRTASKVTTDSVQEEHVQTLDKMKKQTAKRDSCSEKAAGNEYASKVKKEITKRKQSEVASAPMPFEESSKKDHVRARKKPTKLKCAAQPKHGEETRSDTKQASQKFVGAHCSAAGGVSNAVFEAVSMGARAFALFVRNGRTWKLNPLDIAEAEKFKAACKVHGFLPRHILPHGSYLLNCGSSNADTLQKSRDTLVHELQICEMLGLEMYNFHPGSACGKGTVDECLMTVAESINLAHEKTNSVKTVIENMSCQGQTVGGKFEELKIIIDNVKDKSRIGVCLDTCHAFAAGFDLSSEEGFNKCIESFDRIVGLHYLCAMHLNDSKGELGCHLDRHENIGKGHIGLEGFRYVMNDPRLNNIPMILETPVNDYAKEIKILCDLENV